MSAADQFRRLVAASTDPAWLERMARHAERRDTPPPVARCAAQTCQACPLVEAAP